MTAIKILGHVLRAPAYCGFALSFSLVVILILLILLSAVMVLFFSHAAGWRAPTP
jgi:hypothetical protein